MNSKELVERAHAQELEHAVAVNKASEEAHVSVLGVLCHDLKGSGTNASINADLLKELMGTMTWDEGQQVVKDMVDSLLGLIVADNFHLLHSVRAIQLITDLTKGDYEPQASIFDLNRLLSHLSMRYETVTVVRNDLGNNRHISGNEVHTD